MAQDKSTSWDGLTIGNKTTEQTMVFQPCNNGVIIGAIGLVDRNLEINLEQLLQLKLWIDHQLFNNMVNKLLVIKVGTDERPASEEDIGQVAEIVKNLNSHHECFLTSSTWLKPVDSTGVFQ